MLLVAAAPHCTTHGRPEIDSDCRRRDALRHNRPAMTWETRRLPDAYDELAPDGSEIRFLSKVRGASMVHCTLPPGQVTQAVRHKTVEELWFCIAGAGEVWRRSESTQETRQFTPGVAVNIPLGVDFQLRTTSATALEFVIATAPPWPGDDEAIAVDGHWSRPPSAHG
jgi:mannose-6-phosphate isomerase-like protein (cupin superfamily)